MDQEIIQSSEQKIQILEVPVIIEKKKKKGVRFAEESEEEEEKKQVSKFPIIGINNQFLDPNEVKMSLKESEVLQQEDPIIDFQTIEEKQELEQKFGMLDFRLMPRCREVKPSPNFEQILPVALQIRTKPSIKGTRPPIDLCCVVDVSGSMIGKKIELVKDSLRYLMKILGPEDRISIVVFSTVSHYLTPWVRNTPENKEKLKQIILSMQGLASTNIAAGVQKGLWMLKNRKYINPVTCMFLLTDGQDDDQGADLRVKQYIEEFAIEETFLINCFGYGADHDAVVMNQIATYKKGNFYYIEDISKASEYFILSMSGMLSVYAQKIKVSLQQQGNYRIHKVYGENKLWFKQNDQYELKLNYLLLGESKEYILEIEIPSSENESERQECILKGEIEGQFIKGSLTFTKHNELKLSFINILPENQQIDEFVEINWLRTKAGEIIGKACDLASKKEYDNGIQLLNKLVKELEDSPYAQSPHLQRAIEDIKRSKSLCKPSIFEHEGQAFMLKKERNHMIRQSSLTNMLDWNDDQQGAMNNLQNGELQLSACGSFKDDSDLGSDFEEFKKVAIKKIKEMVYNFEQDSNQDQQDDNENLDEQSLSMQEEPCLKQTGEEQEKEQEKEAVE